jgi:4-amino-4-deoxy-L-arabinose transferase-like glycosyltransferase
MDKLASLAYEVTGGERLWIPRLFSILSWIVGGAFLFLIARNLASIDAALVSTGFYLFLPFGVAASRSFQPDPVMTSLMVIALFYILRFYDKARWGSLILAAVTSSIAILLKPVAVFFLFGGFFSVGLCSNGWRRAFLDSKSLGFLAISLLPNALYYGYGIFSAGFLRGQAEASFIPSLFFDLYYWQFWFKHIYGVVGFAALVGGLLGLMVIPRDRRLVFVSGLWIGYIIYGLAFNYHIHTHPYYQLPFIPVVALSVGPIGALIAKEILRRDSSWPWTWAVGCTLSLAVFLSVGLAVRERQELPDFSREVRIAREIGNSVGHSTHTLLLAPFGGRPLRYHGDFSGESWPTQGDMRAERLVGVSSQTVAERFHSFMAREPFEFFVVTDFSQLAEQSDLHEFLRDGFPILVESESYLIFDLR